MNIDLIIAGRRIRLQCGDDLTLQPDERFSAFIDASRPEAEEPTDEAPAEEAPGSSAEAGGTVVSVEPDAAASTSEPNLNADEADLELPFSPVPGPERLPDLIVDVLSSKAIIPTDAVKVFDARLMEETPEGVRDSGDPFWEILTGEGVTYARVWLRDSVSNPVIVMPHGTMNWQIYADSEEGSLNPLPYPVDGLLLYFLSSAMGDIMIHGSGVIYEDRGWIFTGRSGSGKTTIAGIFDRAGDRVIHDDRLILRKDAGGWVMHNTPVYRNDEPRSAKIDHLWGITHGRANVSTPVTGAEAVAMVMSNCVQQNWDREAALRLATSAGELVAAVRISRLAFMPDRSIRDYLVARESVSHVTAADAASAILGEERPVTITAGGYSMWPAIKPGDRIVIIPYDPEMPLAKGMVVALRRDGGFVVHRVTDYRRGKLMNFIRTRGDAGIVYDAWISTRDVAGLVRKVTADNEITIVSPPRMPYYIASIAVAVIKLRDSIRRKF